LHRPAGSFELKGELNYMDLPAILKMEIENNVGESDSKIGDFI
jgi:hypothetical protein